MDFTINARSAKVNANTSRMVEVELEYVEASDILNKFEVSEIINEIGVEKLLDAMDIDDVKKHLGLVEVE